MRRMTRPTARPLASSLTHAVALAAVLAAAAPRPAAADTTMRSENVDLGPDGKPAPNRPPALVTLQIAAGRVRMDAAVAERRHTLIFRKDQETVWMVDHANGTYTPMTKQDVAAARAQLAAAQAQMQQMRSQMEAQLAHVPPEQRKMIEEMMKGQMGGGAAAANAGAPKIEYRKVETGARAGEWKCDRYEGTEGGVKRAEVCAADWQILGMTRADADALAAMSAHIADMIPEGMGMPRAQLFDPEGTSGRGVKGVPVKSVTYRDGQPAVMTRMVEMSHGALKDDVFRLPEGYKEQRFALPGGPPGAAAPRAPMPGGARP
jgi:hypothetical protein